MTTNQQDSPFDTTADATVTRSDRYRALLDEAIVAPVKILVNDYRALVGLLIVGLFLFAGTIGVLLIGIPRASDGEALVAPFVSMQFPLGTDIVGKGIFAQLVHATPAMLKMMFAGGVLAVGMATVWGAVAGYKGGMIDQVMMTVADIVITIPGLPLVVVLAALHTARRSIHCRIASRIKCVGWVRSIASLTGAHYPSRVLRGSITGHRYRQQQHHSS